ncbi:MAG: SPOR domain-containing protein [Sediminibacterium sp.]|nr:SPOR domain-containing protein [Sediminibacterium sp.]
MSVQAIIIKGIEELLLHHDYVVVPNFGGFVTRRQPALFNHATQVLFPPSRKVSFNAQLRQNDGMLEYWLQKRLDCTKDKAVSELDQFAEYCHSLLQVKKRLTFGEIGFFYLNFDNVLCFEPSEQTNFNLDVYGLIPLPVSALPVPEQQPKPNIFKDRVPVRENQETPKTADPSPSQRVNASRYRKYAAMAVAGLALIGTMTFLIVSEPVHQALTAGFWGNKTVTYKPVVYSEITPLTTQSPLNTFVTNAEGFSTLNVNDKVLVVNMSPETTSDDIKKQGLTDHSYQNSPYKIVVGCFSIPDNATRLVKRLKAQHFKAFISGINAKGMQIVSCGGYLSKEAALSELPLVKQTCPAAWIMAPEQ